MMIILFMKSLFYFELHFDNLVKPDITISHEIDMNIILIDILRHLYLHFYLYFLLYCCFSQSKQTILSITDYDPPVDIFYLGMLLDQKSVGYVVLFIY